MKVTPANRDQILNRFKKLAAFTAHFDLMVTQCGWCGKFMGFRRGKGTTGVSHSMCKTCFKNKEEKHWN